MTQPDLNFGSDIAIELEGVMGAKISRGLGRAVVNIEVCNSDLAASWFPLARYLCPNTVVWSLRAVVELEIAREWIFLFRTEDAPKLGSLPNVVCVDSCRPAFFGISCDDGIILDNGMVLDAWAYSIREGTTVPILVTNSLSESDLVSSNALSSATPPPAARSFSVKHAMGPFSPAALYYKPSDLFPGVSGGDKLKTSRDALVKARVAELRQTCPHMFPYRWDEYSPAELEECLRWNRLVSEGWVKGKDLFQSLGVSAFDNTTRDGLFMVTDSLRDTPPKWDPIFRPITFDELVAHPRFVQFLKATCGPAYQMVLRCIASDPARARVLEHLLGK